MLNIGEDDHFMNSISYEANFAQKEFKDELSACFFLFYRPELSMGLISNPLIEIIYISIKHFFVLNSSFCLCFHAFQDKKVGGKHTRNSNSLSKQYTFPMPERIWSYTRQQKYQSSHLYYFKYQKILSFFHGKEAYFLPRPWQLATSADQHKGKVEPVSVSA